MRNLVGLLLLATAPCSLNQAGDLTASRFGDQTHPAVRQRPDTDTVASCGDGALVGTGTRRAPYLQGVTDRSALVMWTGAPGDVVVTRPDGAAVAEVAGEADPAAADQWVARLSGLAPWTMYCYALPGLAGPAGFRTAPAAGSGAPVRFLAFGDSGSGSDDQYALAAQMETVPFDLILHTGDLAYDTGKPDELEDNVFTVYAPLLRSFPFFPTTGNHDHDTEDAAPFRRAFALPGDERWYSFDWGDVHFVALDTELIGAEQAAWLEADLAATTRPVTIVYGHRPPVSSGEHGDSARFQRWFTPILEAHRVPLVLSGHDHDYERSRPQGGVTYVVTGGGGKGTRPVSGDERTAFSEAVIHFVYGEVAGGRITLHAIDGDGTEFDSVEIPVAP